MIKISDEEARFILEVLEDVRDETEDDMDLTLHIPINDVRGAIQILESAIDNKEEDTVDTTPDNTGLPDKTWSAHKSFAGRR